MMYPMAFWLAINRCVVLLDSSCSQQHENFMERQDLTQGVPQTVAAFETLCKEEKGCFFGEFHMCASLPGKFHLKF